MQCVRAVADQTQRPIEAVLPIEQLADDEVLALRDLQLGAGEQDELSELLDRGREGDLP